MAAKPPRHHSHERHYAARDFPKVAQIQFGREKTKITHDLLFTSLYISLHLFTSLYISLHLFTSRNENRHAKCPKDANSEFGQSDTPQAKQNRTGSIFQVWRHWTKEIQRIYQDWELPLLFLECNAELETCKSWKTWWSAAALLDIVVGDLPVLCSDYISCGFFFGCPSAATRWGISRAVQKFKFTAACLWEHTVWPWLHLTQQWLRSMVQSWWLQGVVGEHSKASRIGKLVYWDVWDVNVKLSCWLSASVICPSTQHSISCLCSAYTCIVLWSFLLHMFDTLECVYIFNYIYIYIIIYMLLLCPFFVIAFFCIVLLYLRWRSIIFLFWAVMGDTAEIPEKCLDSD